jgi:hypothetical protein
MRSLNMNELSDVQGGGLSVKWAYKAGELLVEAYNAYNIYEAAKKTDSDPESFGPVDFNGYNPMGDFSNGTCTK